MSFSVMGVDTINIIAANVKNAIFGKKVFVDLVVWNFFLTFAFRHGSTSKTNNMDIKTLTEAEQAMCKHYIDLGDNAEFVKEGIAFCYNNPSQGILLTGINPSGNGGGNVFYTFREAKDIPPSRYWEHKKKQLVGDYGWLIDNMAYLDLFPYFESCQDRFLEAIRPHIDFQVKVLEITQRIIEEYIKPRLIIAANDTAAFYWGFRPNTTWLGYDFIKVDDVPKCLKNTKIRLYRINPTNGFRNASDRVGQDRYHTSNIRGAYFILYAMYDDRHYSSYPDKILTPDIVKELLDWINQQYEL